MSDFAKKFLLEDTRRLGTGGRYVGLAAFGKHPGWDDHVEDLGLETESLNLAKKILYVEGIGGQIDLGAWSKLDAEQQLPAFKHVFLWQRSGQILLGRMWSSSDGKGRKLYPMVVCLHFAGVTLGWALKYGLPVLAELELGCVSATSAGEVRSLLARQLASLREHIQAADARGEYAPVTPAVLHEILHPTDGVYPDSFYRVLYQIESQLGSFALSNNKTRTQSATVRAQQIRVPAVGGSPEQSLLFWTRFLLLQIHSTAPLLLTLPLEAGWVDVTVGEPASHEFFCLRASPKSVPLASEVPYQLDEPFRAKATAFLQRFQQGETSSGEAAPQASPAVVAPTPHKSLWRRWLGVGMVIFLGSLAPIVIFFGPERAHELPVKSPDDEQVSATP